MIRYFVSYLSMTGTQSNFGNLELNLHRPITSMDGVNEIASFIRNEYGLTTVVVMGFTRFADSEDGDA